MNKAAAIFILSISCLMASHSPAETVTQVATMEASVPNIFSLEFYIDANVLHGSEGVTFTNIDPTSSFVYPDGRHEGDGKSDTGVLCRTNMNQIWYLKMNASTTSDFNIANFKYYLGQPWNRNFSAKADGQLKNSAGWYSMPTSSTTLYTAGAGDKANLPLGTLSTFSFAISPAGLSSGSPYLITISYTISATP